MKTEYQIVVDTKSGLCESIESFRNLLNINSNISVNDDTILFSDNSFFYQLSFYRIDHEQKQNIFNISIFLDDDKKIDLYESLLRLVKEILYKVSLSINTIWDDLSIIYATDAYPIISKIENLLRKLITKFMVTKVGLSWSDESLPKVLKQVIKDRKKERMSYANILHRTDFIHLSDFLFKPYSESQIDDLFAQLKSNNLDNISAEIIQPYIPKSNWERYFSTIVDCDDNYFIKKWSRLYELRCLVAHNNLFNKNDLNEIKEISKILTRILEEAISKIDMVVVPEENKNELLENAVTNTSEITAEFLSKWKEIEKAVLKYLSKRRSKYSGQQRSEIRDNINERNSIKIKIPYKNKINELMNIRNKIVHQGTPIIDEKILAKYLREMDEVLKGL